MFVPAVWKAARMSEVLMLRTEEGYSLPLSITLRTCILYSKGRILSFSRRAAWDWFTLSPSLMTLKGFAISIWALTILVWMFRAWKNWVCLGSRPVGPGWTVTS